MLGICGIREAVMPGLYESSDVIGTLTKAASEETGLPQSVKVIAGAGDNAAAAIGTGTVARANAIFRLVHQEQCSFHRINFRWTTITRFIPLRMPTVNIISWAVCLVPHRAINGGLRRYLERRIMRVVKRTYKTLVKIMSSFCLILWASALLIIIRMCEEHL